MKSIKKILASIVMGIGAVIFVSGINSDRFYPYEIKEPQALTYTYTGKGPMKVFLADTGLDTPQRKAVLEKVKEVCEASKEGMILFAAGDLGYPDGVNSPEDEAKNIAPLENICPNHMATLGVPGNHEKYKIVVNGYMAKKYHGLLTNMKGAGWKKGGYFQENYYYTAEIGDVCYHLIDSSPWDQYKKPKIASRIERWLTGEMARCRAGGKLSELVAHHYFFSKSDRKPSDGWKEFYTENLFDKDGKAKVVAVRSGHDHLLYRKVDRGIEHIISGMGAKTTVLPLGFAVEFPGEIQAKFIAVGDENANIMEDDDD